MPLKPKSSSEQAYVTLLAEIRARHFAPGERLRGSNVRTLSLIYATRILVIVVTLVTLSGGLHHRPPAEAIWSAQFFIDMGIGCKYAGITLPEIRKVPVAGLGFCGILIVLTVLFVESVCSLGLAPGLEALLSFAPGGQAELTVLALIVGAARSHSAALLSDRMIFSKGRNL
ncbi:MAG: AbrB family transcriptional regulator [Pseudomonadota bacterium]